MNRRKAIQQTAYLLGGAVSASIIAGVMSGCRAEKVVNWQPQFLDKEQAFLVGELAETILPETDTPGAKELGVPEFMDIMLQDCFTTKEQEQFKNGLVIIDEQCQVSKGQSFLDCTIEDRQKFLVQCEQEGLANYQKTGQKPFVTTLKELVLTGYFTTEYAITELMNYNPIPAQFQGCTNELQVIQVGIEGRSA
ncbi:MAG: gluconate 2-dehydrogenase subunit 3 family protein [Bacteroidota bacterium]